MYLAKEKRIGYNPLTVHNDCSVKIQISLRQRSPRYPDERKGKGDGMLAVLCFLLTAACGFDYCRKRIPNWLVLVLLIHGCVLRFSQDGVPGILGYMANTAILTVLLYPLFKIKTLGAGDVKLFGVVAGYLPFKKIFLFLFFSLLIAAVFSMIKLVVQRNFRERLKVFAGYVQAVMWGGVQPYPVAGRDTVCLSGPVLIGTLLCLGGVY